MIWYVAHLWQKERRRIITLPPMKWEVMFVDLGASYGIVRCQVLVVGLDGMPDHCWVCFPPYHCKLQPGQKRVHVTKLRMEHLSRTVAENMPNSWDTWTADLLGLQGGSKEVRGRGTTRAQAPTPVAGPLYHHPASLNSHSLAHFPCPPQLSRSPLAAP